MNDYIIKGWKEMGAFLGVHPNTVAKRKDEMLEKAVIWRMAVGRPQRRFWCTTRDLLIAFVTKKGKF
jgi:hypothetical protein